ncbi:MAG: hypothetical protein AAGD86_11880 [Pseudomonadota bacterium]
MALAIVVVMLLSGCATSAPTAASAVADDAEVTSILVVRSVLTGTPQCGTGRVWFCERNRGKPDNCGCVSQRILSPAPGTSPWQRF